MRLRSAYHESERPAPREFPLALAIQYHVVSDGAPRTRANGRTLWISSREIIFQGETPLSSGAEVEITIAWPARLDERIGLQLWIRGRVLRTLADGITVEISKYQFRTRRTTRAFAADSSGEAASHSFSMVAAGTGVM